MITSSRRPVLAIAALCLAGPAAAQRATLEMRPRPGDTLFISISHAVTISGGPRNVPDSTTTYTTSYDVATRNIIEWADEKGTVILAIVDSVRMRTTGSIGASPFPGVDRGMERLRVRLRVVPDGSSEIIEGLGQLDPELREILGAMPSVLPLTPVRPTDTWVRALPVPTEGPGGAKGPSATLRTLFRLDSLTHNGDRAWISLRGTLEPGLAPAPQDGVAVTRMTGTLTGTLVLDRRRGWLERSQATMEIESLVATPGGGTPLLVRVKVEQLMQTVARR